MTKNNRPMWIAFGAAMALSVAFGVFIGCADGRNHGSNIPIEGCDTAPLSDFLYESCVLQCEEDPSLAFCEVLCDDEPTLPFCDPGTGGTGGDGGTGGTAGTGGVAGEGGSGGTIPECRCSWECLDGNYCTYDWCEDGVCEQSLRPEGTFCKVDGHYGTCDSEGNCEPYCRECGKGHCKEREHKHQFGQGHCEEHCHD